MSPNETTTPAGAMPVVAGATPAQTQPVEPIQAPATDADEQLGEAGKRALLEERAAAKAAKAEVAKLSKRLADIEAANQTESQKAITDARKEGAAEALGKAQTMVRRAEVRRALATAGCSDADIAAMAGDFSSLEVDEDGMVAGLEKAVTAFKVAHPALFTAKRPTGSADGGVGGTAANVAGTFTRSQLRDQKFFAANKDAILAAAKAGRIIQD